MTIPHPWAFAAAALLLAGCGSAAPGAPSGSAPPSSATGPSAPATPVQIAFAQISNVHSPLFVAQEMGYFAHNGLAPNIQMVTGPAIAASIAAGEVQFGSIGGNEVIHADLGGASLVGIATLSDVPVFGLYADKKYKSVGDLAGQTIGVTALGTTTDATAQLILKHYGMLGKVKISSAGGSNTATIGALTNGLIAAVILNPENGAQATDLGFVELANAVTLGEPFNFDVIAVNRAYLRDHRDVAQRFLRAYQQAWTFLGDAGHRAEVIGITQKYTKSPDKLAAVSYDAFLPIWSGSKVPTIDPRAIGNILAFSTEPSAKDAKPEQFIDNSIIQASQS